MKTKAGLLYQSKDDARREKKAKRKYPVREAFLPSDIKWATGAHNLAPDLASCVPGLGYQTAFLAEVVVADVGKTEPIWWRRRGSCAPAGSVHQLQQSIVAVASSRLSNGCCDQHPNHLQGQKSDHVRLPRLDQFHSLDLLLWRRRKSN